MHRMILAVAVPTLALGCGAGQQGRVEPTGAEPGDHAAPPAEDAAAEQHPGLAEALAAMCSMMTEEMADRSRPLSGRIRRANDRLERSSHVDVVTAFLRRVPQGSGDPTLEDISAQAETDGVPGGYRCEPHARALLLWAARDQDIDPSLAASLPDDLALLCRLANGVLVDPEMQSDRVNYFHRDWHDHITAPALCELFRNLDSHPWDQRYEALRQTAIDGGSSGWSCPAIEQIYQPTNPTP